MNEYCACAHTPWTGTVHARLHAHMLTCHPHPPTRGRAPLCTGTASQNQRLGKSTVTTLFDPRYSRRRRRRRSHTRPQHTSSLLALPKRSTGACRCQVYQQLENACQAELRACRQGGKAHADGDGDASSPPQLLIGARLIYLQLAAAFALGMLLGNQMPRGLLLQLITRVATRPHRRERHVEELGGAVVHSPRIWMPTDGMKMS